jgi:membrane-associated protein
MPRIGRSRRLGALAAILLIAGMLGSVFFGLRTWGTFLVLRSAYEVGLPTVSTVRAWMTLGYVAATYGLPLDALTGRLDLPAATPPDTVLRDIADQRGMSRIDMVRAVQSAMADLGPELAPDGAPGEPDASDGLGDALLAALLAYSYPALGLVLLLGAIGVPVPTGFATVLAGSLAAAGQMNWPIASAVAIVASIIGDIAGYGIGRLAGERFIARHGHLLGYAGHRKARVEWLFARWGGATVLMTRTLVSHLSSLASLLAGLSRYGFGVFLAYAAVGRVVWTAAYFGLGYFIGNDLDAASSFLGNVTGLLIAAGLAAASASYLVRGTAFIRR